ncbi:MAG TPA: EamA family transporter [Gaiellaceae bacterium]|nr:EamA family transporter [Gaiellaceae bacterium]
MAVDARRRAALVVAGLAVVYVVWGSTYLGIAVAIETLPPLLMAGARFVVAGAVLYAAARLVGGGRQARLDRSQWGAAALSGILMLAVGNGGVSWAEQTVPSGIAAIVIASIPLWVVVLDRLAFGARLSWVATVGVAVGFAGVAFLVNPAAPDRIDPAGGVVLLLAAAGWATGTLLSRGQRLTVPPLLGAGMQMLCGGVALLVAGALAGELGEVQAPSWRSALALAYLVVFGSLLAFSAYVWLLRNARVSLVATYAYVNPVVAVLLGWAFLDEAVTSRTLVAGGVILGAVALIVSARPARGPAPARPSRRARLRSAGRSRAAAATRGR